MSYTVARLLKTTSFSPTARNALVCRPHNFAVRVEREEIGVSTRVVGVVRIQDVGELESVVGENGMDERSRVLTLVDEVSERARNWITVRLLGRLYSFVVGFAAVDIVGDDEQERMLAFCDGVTQVVVVVERKNVFVVLSHVQEEEVKQCPLFCC